jgi:hypothetical protein
MREKPRNLRMILVNKAKETILVDSVEQSKERDLLNNLRKSAKSADER